MRVPDLYRHTDGYCARAVPTCRYKWFETPLEAPADGRRPPPRRGLRMLLHTAANLGYSCGEVRLALHMLRSYVRSFECYVRSILHAPKQ